MRRPGSRTEVLSTGFTLIWSNLNRIFQNFKERTGTELNNLSTCEP